MKRLLFILALALTGCGESTPIPSIEHLSRYPVSCAKKTEQLQYLKKVQKALNFAKDPDDLSDEDRAYNSKLKSTIWWYSWNCSDEKLTASTSSSN